MQVVQARATFIASETVDGLLTTIVARSVLKRRRRRTSRRSSGSSSVARTALGRQQALHRPVVHGHRGAPAALVGGRDRVDARRRGGRVPVRRAGRRGPRLEGRDRDRGNERSDPRSCVPGCGFACEPASATQQARVQATTQVGAAATAQVEPAAVRAQVANVQSKVQVSKSQVAKVSGPQASPEWARAVATTPLKVGSATRLRSSRLQGFCATGESALADLLLRTILRSR